MWWQLIKLHAWRERNNPEFRILMLALAIAIFSVTTISCLTLSLRTVVNQDASKLLGADLILEAPHPIAPSFQEIAEQQGIAVTLMVEFFSMVTLRENMQLTSIAAMNNAYPLRGKLIIDDNTGQEQLKHAPPELGKIWIEESLAIRLNAKLNEEVTVGALKLTIAGIIHSRPVATSDSNALAPVALVNAQDLSAMAVLQPGSRATYRLLFAGTAQQLANFRLHFKNTPVSDLRWVTPQSGRQSVSRTIHYTQRYLSVILLIEVFLAGVAIGMCSHQYSQRQQGTVAMWRCLGASSTVSIGIHVLSLCLLAGIVCALSISMAYLAANGIVIYGKQFGITVSHLGWEGGLLGALTGIIMLLGFGVAPVLELRKVTPMQILQQHQIFSPQFSISSYVIALSALGLLFYSYIGELDVALRLGAQVIVLSIIAFIFAWSMWYLFEPLKNKGPLVWRFGISYLIRHKWQIILQWFVFTIVMMLLLLVQILQHDFVRSWQRQLPESTPNYFLINIQPMKIVQLQEWFRKQGVLQEEFYPIVRGRMSHVNGISVDTPDKSKQQARGLQRPINLTWAAKLPSDNRAVEGQAWSQISPGQALISVEKGFADRQFLKLGDSIDFQIAEQKVSGKIVQLRTVEWESFKPNFFVIFPPQVLEQFSHEFITSFYLPKSQKKILRDLSKIFVELTIIDIDSMLENVRKIVLKLSIALNILLIIVLILGILIMYANLLSTLKERFQESAMMRILGASKWFIVKVRLVEFGVLGVLSGVVASVNAIVIAHDLAHRFFAVPFIYDSKWLLIGVVMSTLLIMTFGMIASRAVLSVSPLWLFRKTK